MTLLSIPIHIMSLDDPGDIQAPEGSQPWARGIKYQLERLDREGKARVRDFQIYLKLLDTHKGYQQLADTQGHPFPSLSAFATAPAPFGLGYNAEVMLHLQHETRDMLLKETVAEKKALLAQAHPKKGRPEKCADSAHLMLMDRSRQNGVGRDTQRKLDYLAGHAPDLLHEVQHCRLSPHAAYQRAKGHVPETPFAVLLRAWRRVTRDDRVRFLREMLSEEERAELLAELLAIETRAT